MVVIALSKSVVITKSNESKSSYLVSTNDDLTVERGSTEKPTGVFGRKLYVQTSNLKWSGDDVDIEFNSPFDDDLEANQTDISLWNLSDDSIGRINQDDLISIIGGYGDDTGVIYSGFIQDAYVQHSGCDHKTIIRCVDYPKMQERSIQELKYDAGVKASTILYDLIKLSGLPVAQFETARDWDYDNEVSVNDNLYSSIKKYAEICGVSAFINRSKVYVMRLNLINADGFNVNKDTGMIGSPERFSETKTAEGYSDFVVGYKVTMLLNHKITTASIINLNSEEVSGIFRVRSGTHSLSGDNFLTTVEVIP